MAERDDNNAERFLRLVNALDHAIVWEFDDTLQLYTFVSDHAHLVLGYVAADWLEDRSRFERCIVPEDLPGFLAMIEKLRTDEANDLRFEHRCFTADGRVVWVHTGVHAATERGHRILRGVTIDITNVKAAEERERTAREQAEKATRNLEDVLAIVSHDVRNPLNSLVIALELLRTEGADLAKVTTTIARSVDRLRGLIDDLIDVANIRSQRLRIDHTEAESDALVADAVRDHSEIALAKGIALTAAPAAAVSLHCDPRRVAQVLANLVGNAVKFTPVGGAVEVSVVEDAHEVRFSVRDTGDGIALDDQPHVFERHWQAPSTSSQGSGLGLFIAKAIVDAHAGRIWLDSTPGHGATFSFTLPRR